MPFGICTMESSESTPLRMLDFTGTPSTDWAAAVTGLLAGMAMFVGFVVMHVSLVLLVHPEHNLVHMMMGAGYDPALVAGRTAAAARVSSPTISSQSSGLSASASNPARVTHRAGLFEHRDDLGDLGREAGVVGRGADRSGDVGLVELEVGAVARQPREVEGAIYFCCLEALQNIVKYADESPDPKPEDLYKYVYAAEWEERPELHGDRDIRGQPLRLGEHLIERPALDEPVVVTHAQDGERQDPKPTFCTVPRRAAPCDEENRR